LSGKQLANRKTRPGVLAQRRAAAFTKKDPAPVGRLIKEELHTIVWRAPHDSGEPAVIKMYRRRGIVKSLRERVFSFRAEREYAALDHLVRSQIPCSVPLAWRYGSSTTHGRFETLTTREIVGARSLRALGRSQCAFRWEFQSLYRMIRQVHDSGLYHAVMHVDNVLAVPTGDSVREFYLIDMPRSILFPHSIVGTRMAWFDLQYLSYGLLTELGIPQEKIPLDAYGLDDREQRQFLQQLPSFSRSNMKRKRLRAEAFLRLGLARLGHRAEKPRASR
jgi:hypothetical protein